MDNRCSGFMVEGRPYVLIHTNRLICSPDKAAREECEEKENSIVQLGARASHVEFVKEPVEVQEWG